MRYLAATLLALAIAAPAAQAATPKSCTRDGAKLEAAAGKVRVVSRKLKLRMNETRRQALLACWTSTGKRKQMLVEQDVGEDLITRVDIHIVDARYVGLDVEFEGGASESTTAAVWDAKTRKRLHTSKRCDQLDQIDFSGPEDVEFLPHGGLAFSCGPLWLFKRAKTAAPTQLETANVRQIGSSTHAFGQSNLLYWTLDDGTIKSLDLGV
jgi:hypothetical protein